jgi:hypothetical protein
MSRLTAEEGKCRQSGAPLRTPIKGSESVSPAPLYRVNVIE